MGVLRKELEPGLHISRRSRDDFYRFLRVARFFTCFVRLREAGCAAPWACALAHRLQGAANGKRLAGAAQMLYRSRSTRFSGAPPRL